MFSSSTGKSLSPVPTQYEKPQPSAQERSTIASVCIVAACTSALMMSAALGPAISILLPYAGENLHIQKDSLQWIVNAYSITSVNHCIITRVRKCLPWPRAQACFLLLCGRLADLYGRKRVWLAGYFILGVFSVGAGLAPCM